MREIFVDDGVSLKVFSEEDGLARLAQSAVFVVPHTRHVFSPDWREVLAYPSVSSFNAGIVGVAKINKDGIYGRGSSIVGDRMKHVVSCYNDEADRQVERYIGLLSLTDIDREIHPVSVVLVDNKGDWPLNSVASMALECYKDTYVSENRPVLNEQISVAVEREHPEHYGVFSFSGLRRRFKNRTMTVYVGDSPFIEMAAGKNGLLPR